MNWLTSVVVPLVTATVGTGLVGSLLFFRQTRRQIEAGASEDEATAVDILTGAALKMVTEASTRAAEMRDEAVSAREEATRARKRAEEAEERAAGAERAAVECAAEVVKLSRLTQRYREYVGAAGLSPLPEE